ncbi:MAG TPA: hypothetical protein VHV55_17615 [Pirellulales bacterium]|jgi:hypothetical protein|nr:hypothetical protein [Pirellulales bacterium]
MATALPANQPVKPRARSRFPFGWMTLAAVVAYVASRACLLAAFAPLFSDYQTYFQRAASGVDLGLVPYRDFTLEYPPAAYWCLALPRWLAPARLPRGLLGSGLWVKFVPDYGSTFRWEMLGFDVLAFVLLLAIVARRRRELLAPAAWTYVLLTTILAPVLLDRLDIGVLCLLLVWAWSWLRLDPDGSADSGRARLLPSRDIADSQARVSSAGASPSHLPAGSRSGSSRCPAFWQTLAYLALGLGCSYKLIPAAIVPLVIIADVRAMRTFKDILRLAGGLLAFAATAVGPFAYYYHAAGPKLWSMFQYHKARGLEIESLWGSLVLALRPLGLEVRAVNSYGSWNVASRFDVELLALSTVAMALILIVGLIRACWPTRPFTRGDAYRWSLLTLLGLVLAAKVLSVQYLLWGLPAALLLGAERLSRGRFLLLCGGLLLIAALTTAVFPVLFFPQLPLFGHVFPIEHALIPKMDWLPAGLLIARNVLLIALFAGLASMLFKGQPAKTAAATAGN